MKHTYLINERIRLRAMEPEDLAVVCAMENDPGQWAVSNFTVPYSLYAMRHYLEHSQNNLFSDLQVRMVIACANTNEVIGVIDICDFSPVHQRAEAGIVIQKKFQHNGYAREALLLLCDYAFGFLYLKQLTAHIALDNETSLRLFESCGFTQCGLLKAWLFVEGDFKDVVLLQRLRP
ncbi:MAG: GNAT family N-acetyltransferase [Prevotellaceae bacterium]|jgi:diamine N-acetyltransferase|nr:GNAT family N-acetyltransferase [Prevotellaceae bacterium]